VAEQFECFLTRAANLLVYPCRPKLHLLIHPITAALAVDDADTFADGVQDEVRLLGDQRALERKEIGRVGKDRRVMIVPQRFDRLVNAAGFDNVKLLTKGGNHSGINRLLSGEDEDFGMRFLHEDFV
jgi:hypothetical protein